MDLAAAVAAAAAAVVAAAAAVVGFLETLDDEEELQEGQEEISHPQTSHSGFGVMLMTTGQATLGRE